MSSKINILVSLCPWMCVHVCVHLKKKRDSPFGLSEVFAGLWVDRSMLGGRHTLSRVRIAVERPLQSVLARPVP